MNNECKSSTSGGAGAARSNDGITPDGQQFSSSLQESMKEGVQIVELKKSDVMSPFVTMFSSRGHLVIENRAGKSYKKQLNLELPLVIVKPESDDSFSYKLLNFKKALKTKIRLQKDVPIILVGCNDTEAKNLAKDMGSLNPVYNVLRHDFTVPLDIGSIFSGSTENELQVSMGDTGVLHYSPNYMSEPIKVAGTLTIPNHTNLMAAQQTKPGHLEAGLGGGAIANIELGLRKDGTKRDANSSFGSVNWNNCVFNIS